MNEHDSERIAGLMANEGMVNAASIEEADVVVLNTCCIRENADNKLYGALGRLKAAKQARPELKIVVGGCLAQKDRDLIQRRAGHVDVVFGTHNVERLTALLAASASGPVMEIVEESDEFPSALPVQREVPYAAWSSIQIGCDNTCAFCIVPSVRGEEKSRPLLDIVDEVAVFASQGVTEVTLLGQNVNSYGRDLTLSMRAGLADSARLTGYGWMKDRKPRPLFGDLLREVGAVDGIKRVRFTSPHPKDLREDVVIAMAQTPTVCPQLHLPLQSGSDEVLMAMRRGYTVKRYLAALEMARLHIEDLAVSTDIIVGFPGETDDDFQRTLQVVAEVEYDSAFTFKFSPRPGTRAAEMTELFVDPDTVTERYLQLEVVVKRSALARNQKRIGQVEELLVEGDAKRGENRFSGRTPQGKLVHFVSPKPIAAGSYVLVRIFDATAHYMLGELIEVLARPRHRNLIPVQVGSS